METKILQRSSAAVLVGTTLMVVGAAICKGPFSAEAAAWAQAGGSIGALLIAIYVSQLALDAENRRRRQARIDQVDSITTVVDMALNNFDPIRVAVRFRAARQVQDGFAQLANAQQQPLQDILKTPLPEWPSAVLYSRVLAVSDALQRYRTYMNEVRPTIHADVHHWNGGQTCENELARVEQEYRQSVAGLKVE